MTPSAFTRTSRLLALAQEKDVGVMIIKSVTKGRWGDRPHAYNTWYEPFDDPTTIERCVDFVLSQNVTAFASPGDLRLLPMALAAPDVSTALRDSRSRKE